MSTTKEKVLEHFRKTDANGEIDQNTRELFADALEAAVDQGFPESNIKTQQESPKPSQ